MTNFEKLKKITKESEQIRKEREEIKDLYYSKQLPYADFISQSHFNDDKRQKNEILYNIIKNNLLLEIHNSLMTTYKEVYKKYASKAIGEKRQEEIRKIFENQISNILQYDDSTPYYNRFYLYFNYKVEYNRKIFEISIEKLRYDFYFYLDDNDEIKSRYNIDYPIYVENEEEEAERLTKLLNTTKEKREEIEKLLDNLKEELSENFKKNLYNDEVSRFYRSLTLN